MSRASTLLAVLMAGAAIQSHASVITLSAGRIPTTNGSATVTFQPDAASYRSVVTGLVTNPTTKLGSVTLASFNNVIDASVFGTNSNFAWMATIDFGVTAAQAGNWSFRAGVDFGYGGALFVDGVAVDSKSSDMWWGGSYSNPSQYLASSLNLAAGNHTLQLYGMEGCCDGGSQVQFKAANAAAFTSFASTDGLNAVPEPATLATLGLGLGAMIGLRRRQGKRG